MNFNLIKILVISSLVISLPFVTNAQNEQAGKTLLAKGQVEALSKDTQSKRALKRRKPVFKVDNVKTYENSQAQLKMIDGALLALKAQTELNIEEYFLSNDKSSGSVVMELVSGGLRTITGSIKGNTENYKLKTPVGSIGIRGTHYEVEIINGDVFLAVWDGSIEISNLNLPEPLILGKDGTHSFAKLDNTGEVKTFLKPPEQLSSLSSPTSKSKTKQTSNSLSELTSTVVNIPQQMNKQDAYLDAIPLSEKIQKTIEDTSFLNEDSLDNFASEDIEGLIAERTGTVIYDQVERFEINSSGGPVNDFNMQMNVDFDAGTVPLGQLSFSDSGGEWFATFNGLINTQGMRLGINYASHGQNLATGNITAQFSDELSKIRGNFNLYEINDIATRSSGLFVIKEK